MEQTRTYSLLKGGLLLLLCLTLNSCWLTDRNEKEGISSDIINNPNSAQGREEGGMPVLEFEDQVHEFGTISQGEKVKHAFVFSNSGEAPLVIASIEPSCGCTVAEETPEEPIMPGEKDTLNVSYDSGKDQGRQDRTVAIVANTSPKTTMIRMQGTVKGPR